MQETIRRRFRARKVGLASAESTMVPGGCVGAAFLRTSRYWFYGASHWAKEGTLIILQVTVFPPTLYSAWCVAFEADPTAEVFIQARRRVRHWLRRLSALRAHTSGFQPPAPVLGKEQAYTATVSPILFKLEVQ